MKVLLGICYYCSLLSIGLLLLLLLLLLCIVVVAVAVVVVVVVGSVEPHLAGEIGSSAGELFSHGPHRAYAVDSLCLPL